MVIRILLSLIVAFSVQMPSFARAADTPTPAPGCQDFTTKEPPFFISDGKGDKNWEDFKSPSNFKATIGFLPKSSIVRVQPALQKAAIKSGRNVFIPVEVISIPDSNLLRTAAKSRQPLKGNVLGRKKVAEPGNKGYVAQESLEHVSGYTFMIRKDSPLFETHREFAPIAGRALRLAQNEDGSFQARYCCFDDVNNGPMKCETRYVFQVLTTDLSRAETTFTFNPVGCAFCTNFLRPVKNDQINPIKDIINMTEPMAGKGIMGLEFIDSMGLVKIPVDPNTGAGPFGSIHYSPEKGNAISDDAFADLTAACAFMRVLQRQQSLCKSTGCQIQWGDAYYPYRKNGRKEHQGHDDGQCLDIRPLRKSDGTGPLRWTKSSKTDYDYEKTTDFVQLLKAAGANPVYFNDKRTGAQHWPGHDDHIHACFFPQNPMVQQVCQEGIRSNP